MVNAVLWCVLIFLLVALGVSIWWMIISEEDLKTCESTESVSCPVFYCGPIIANGNPGTKCINPNGTSQKTAFRYDEYGNLECQQYITGSVPVADLPR
uniref:Uncharacterized protein n=1 Tax=viral metagenome TaxID=1070528 RepID=A0A6C0ADN3_9ZZZZ